MLLSGFFSYFLKIKKKDCPTPIKTLCSVRNGLKLLLTIFFFLSGERRKKGLPNGKGVGPGTKG